MPYSTLFIWVEGNDDVRLFNTLVSILLKSKYDHIEVRPYSQEPEKKIDNFLKGIKAMGAEYIFVCDIDSELYPCVTARKLHIQKKYKNVDTDRIMVIIKEVEGWYAAGVTENICRNLGMKYLNYTNDMTKEDFNKLIPKHFGSRLDFMLELLKHFSVETARKRNNSFVYFLQKYTS